MRVDFYQLGGLAPETAVAQLAARARAQGLRLLVVAGDEALLARISAALWAHGPESFLAHGMAGGEHDARQPILLSTRPEAANGAEALVLADGQWREASGFARALLLFDDATIGAARGLWRELGQAGSEGERNFWRLEAGRWKQAR